MCRFLPSLNNLLLLLLEFVFFALFEKPNQFLYGIIVHQGRGRGKTGLLTL
jgi:hypothetical protein